MFDSLYTNSFNFAVDKAANGANTIYVVPDGKKIAVLDLFLQAEGDVEITLKSNATVLTGPINFTTATARERRFTNNGAPVFKTIATGDDLVMFLSAGVQVNGYGIGVEVHS